MCKAFVPLSKVPIEEFLKPRTRKGKEPTKSPNAFIIYRIRRGQEILENRKLPQPDISKMLGQEWEEMDSSKKNEYFEYAKRVKEKFDKRVKEAKLAQNNIVVNGNISSNQCQMTVENDSLINALVYESSINEKQLVVQQNEIPQEVIDYQHYATPEEIYPLAYESSINEKQLVAQQNEIPQEVIESGSLNNYGSLEESSIDENQLAAQPNGIPQAVIESDSLNNYQQYVTFEGISLLVSNENQVVTQQNEIPQEVIENGSLNNYQQYEIYPPVSEQNINENQLAAQQNEIPQEVIESGSLNNYQQYGSLEESSINENQLAAQRNEIPEEINSIVYGTGYCFTNFDFA
ncbi:963_t:CDS:1 [Ambispora leptoticha]|uniref:963_t:CDS:1 n=1 Tax=Ambispora leptoticha TaxID=144679 RepID=A0A9N9D6T3_9GLOM|nr:963_t:CDS:1 [Ambispora leptoticha]